MAAPKQRDMADSEQRNMTAPEQRNMAAELLPLPHPIAIFPQFVANQYERLKVKEKGISLFGLSYSVETYPVRQPLFQVKGEAFSTSGRKAVEDRSGNHLFTIARVHMSFPSAYYAVDPTGKTILEVDGRSSIHRPKAIGRVSYSDPASETMKHASLMMKGNFSDSKVDIIDEATGAIVAHINRKFFHWTPRQLFGGWQTYMVSIAEGMDMALIVAMCICLDDREGAAF